MQIEDGHVVMIKNNEESVVIGKVHTGYLGIDGNYLLEPNSPVIKLRRKIAREGYVSIVVFLTEDRMLVTDPVISTPGILDKQEDKDLIDLLADEIKYLVSESKKHKRKKDNSRLEDLIKDNIKRIIKKDLCKLAM